ncbi:MAG: threonine/serine exporter family protein [Clostridia bacterium]|nr:threonine/serine exporter family protein [Clostridia bacterium]
MIKSFGYAMDIGEQMLISGAEVHRVEESINRMCYALGAIRVDVFIITSSMVVTVYTKDGNTYTQTRRVTSTKNFDFEKLHHLNNLSREICEKGLTEQEIEKKLRAANNCKKIPVWFEFICYAVIAGAFTLFFGGNIIESFISLFVGAVVRLSLFFSGKIISNKFFDKFTATVIITLLAFLTVELGWIISVDKVIIANIMTLIPGIGLTNAIRDLFTGDSIAGLLRSIEAVLTALAIAAGYFLVTVLGGVFL